MAYNLYTRFYKTKRGSMTQTGKAFEYAILKEFDEKLNNITNVQIVQSDALATAKNALINLTNKSKGDIY